MFWMLGMAVTKCEEVTDWLESTEWASHLPLLGSSSWIWDLSFFNGWVEWAWEAFNVVICRADRLGGGGGNGNELVGHPWTWCLED